MAKQQKQPASHFDATHILANPDQDQAQELVSDLLPAAMDHLIAAFKYKAGLGPHPGEHQGPEVKDPFSMK